MFRRILVPSALVLVLLGLVVFWLLTRPHALDESILPAGGHLTDITNGEALFWVGGCGSCHGSIPPANATPQARMAAKRILSGGQALASPFGTFHAPNISTDPVHGIGAWSELDFINAMSRGISPDKSHYYPAFPYTSYQRMTVPDLLDLKAYLDTLPADATPTRAHDLPFPFTIRRGLGLWKLLYMDEEPFVAPEDADAELARGAYLVEGPGHCAQCHTPRTPLGGLIEHRAYSGAANPEGDGRIPNITPHADGIASWSVGDIAYALESGFMPDFDSFGGSMVSVQENMAHLSPEDRMAIARYLKSLTPLPSEPAP